MARPAAAMEQFQAPSMDIPAMALSQHISSDVMPQSFGRTVQSELPSTLDFSPAIYPTDASTPIEQLPAATPEQLRAVFDSATGVNFTSAADNQASGQQPDFYLGTDGVLRPNPNKKEPNADGSINIELQAKNKYDTDAKKFADQLQKAAIKDLISYFTRSNPSAKIPQDWLDQLSQEPDLPPAPVPITIDQPAVIDPPAPPQDQPQDQPQPQPQPQPSDSTSSAPVSGGSGSDGGSSSGGGGGSSGGGGGGSGGGGGGHSGGGGGHSSGGGGGSSGGGDSSSSSTSVPDDKLSNIRTIVEVAKEKGIDPALAVATSLIETGGTFDNKIVGDNGHSIGLFQLNDGGEGYNVSLADKQDPRHNAEIALGVMAQYLDKATDFDHNGSISGGEIAASAQRPADQAGYAQKVDAAIPEAQALIEQAEKTPEIVNMPVGAWGGYSNGQIPDSALEKVYGFKVAPGVAENLTALLDAAQKDGVWNPSEPYATGTYRTYDQQVSLYNQKGPDWAATPGKSLHGWGEAIDFNMNNPQLISWLKDNAEKYGFKNLPKEPWHYSTNGN
ncbi:MAG: M15 family metallopeptidase [Cyanobacteria bacterium SZAS-4]|nr:M15 family metallopeptidase [Cyanobacteria bacterium SZAS-4]